MCSSTETRSVQRRCSGQCSGVSIWIDLDLEVLVSRGVPDMCPTLAGRSGPDRPGQIDREKAAELRPLRTVAGKGLARPSRFGGCCRALSGFGSGPAPLQLCREGGLVERAPCGTVRFSVERYLVEHTVLRRTDDSGNYEQSRTGGGRSDQLCSALRRYRERSFGPGRQPPPCGHSDDSVSTATECCSKGRCTSE